MKLVSIVKDDVVKPSDFRLRVQLEFKIGSSFFPIRANRA